MPLACPFSFTGLDQRSDDGPGAGAGHSGRSACARFRSASRLSGSRVEHSIGADVLSLNAGRGRMSVKALVASVLLPVAIASTAAAQTGDVDRGRSLAAIMDCGGCQPRGILLGKPNLDPYLPQTDKAR